jgi:hypothetical protein
MNAAFASKMGLEDQHALGGAGYFVPGIVGALTAKGPGTYGAPEIDAGQIICAAHGQHNAAIESDLAPTLSCLHEAPYIAHALTSSPSAAACPNEDATLIPMVTHSLRAEGFGAGEDGCGRGTPLVPVYAQDVADPLVAKEGATWTHEGENNFRTRNVTAFSCKDSGQDATDELSPTLRSNGPGHDPVGTRIREGMSVRRLTPRECERLQGVPDDYTLVPYRNKPAADGPRYKALGNSMAVPVMHWIGQRIDMVEALLSQEKAA